MIGRIKAMIPADTPRRSTRAAEPTIAAGVVRALLELAVAKGASRRELLERSGLDPDALEDQDARIPLAQWLALMRIGKKACGDPALALHFGEAFDVADMSVVGLIGRSVATKGEGLEMLNRFCRLVIDVETEGEERFELARQKGESWLIDTRLNPNEAPEVSETGFAQMAAMAQLMLPGMQHLKAVHFTHPAPSYLAEYERIFQVPVFFDSDRNAFLMPEGWEADPIAIQPRYALDILGAHAEALLERLDSSASLMARVEALLPSMLANGAAGAAAVAGALGLSKQTLYRRLKAESVTFDEIVEAVRRKLAVHYLRDRHLSVKDTAYRLGFADPSAFSRAFKRWTGSSPSAFREGSGD